MSETFIVLAVEYAAKVSRDFPVVDGKGRTIGAQAQIVDHVFRDATDEERAKSYRYNYAEADRNPILAPVTRYGFRPHALRNGQPYGSSHGTNLYDTAAERDAAIEKYFAGAAKRAAKVKGAKSVA